MYELRIFQRGKGMGRGKGMTSKCRSCGADIYWIKMTSGKSMPCDVKPYLYRQDPEGDLVLVTPDGRTVKGFEDLDSEEFGYTSHFATCPNANQHRRRRK